MANKKKVAPSPVDEKVYDGSFTYTDLNGKEVEVKYNNAVSLSTVGAHANNIVNSIVNEEYGYLPYLYDVVLYKNILEMYTDFDISISFDEFSELLCKTNLMERFAEPRISLQYLNFIDHVDNMIDYKKQHSINSEIDSTFTGLLNDFRTLLAKANNFLDLDPDVLGKVVNNLAGMEGISQKDLIDAIVDKSGVAKGKGGKGKTKDNVVELPDFVGQQRMDGSEVTE